MRVVTAFCLACVCTELLVQLVEAGWARRCIKVVAGLYILTVLLRANFCTACTDRTVASAGAGICLHRGRGNHDPHGGGEALE